TVSENLGGKGLHCASRVPERQALVSDEVVLEEAIFVMRLRALGLTVFQLHNLSAKLAFIDIGHFKALCYRLPLVVSAARFHVHACRRDSALFLDSDSLRSIY